MQLFMYYLILAYGLFHLVTSTRYSCNTTAICGCSKTNAEVNKIVGGESAVDASWGWSISIQTRSGQHFCGGSILSPNFIITAAHCFNDVTSSQQIRVVAGIDKLSESSSNKAQIRLVTNFVIHPGYDKNNQANDIAVVRLSEALSLTLERNPSRLCLPSVKTSNQMSVYPAIDLSLVAIGWGVLSSGGSVPSNLHLQQVTLKSMSSRHEMCERTVKDKRIQFCAAQINGGKDTCQGDSGGPIMHFEPHSRQWVLVGITSYGVGCGDRRYAGVYTRVSAYENWLKSIVTDGFHQTSVNQTSADSGVSRNIFSFSSSIFLLGFSLFFLF